jgi:phage terminase large subunit-like protein
VYDEDKADRAVKFVRKLKHTKDPWAGKPFNLLPWQENEILRPLFGTVDENGHRLYRKCYVEVPKKNGKSELAAAIALYLLIADGEYGAEIYGAACDRGQASIVFDIAATMIDWDPYLKKILKVLESTKRILYPRTRSFYHVLSSDVPTKHGKNIHGCIFDELHVQPNRKLWDVLTEGAGDTRTQPLVFAITTAGYDRNSICWEVHDYARKVKEGIIEDPHFLPVIYGLPKEEDWEDEENWKKVNPSLGHTFTIDKLRAAYNECKHIPARQNSFRRLRLDQWTKQEVRYIPMTFWDRCNRKVSMKRLKGKVCYGGLDLASCIDIAAFAKAFPADDGFFDVLMRFWIPEENILERADRDKVPYDMWVQEGWIRATPGNVIDYAVIEQDIKKDAEIYLLAEIAYDPWGALQITQNLEAEGITMVQFRQGFKSMSPPTKELLKLIMSRKIRHGGNPVLRWMADNLMVSTDPAENVKPDKKKSTERIDGMVALIMALDRTLRHEDKRSVYEDRGLVYL